jgi:hypothetical protein
MTLSLRNLSAMSYGNGMTFWGYRTKDTRRELEGASYWKEIVSRLSIGDFVFVHHIGRGSAIYCIGPLGHVNCMTEWPFRKDQDL